MRWPHPNWAEGTTSVPDVCGSGQGVGDSHFGLAGALLEVSARGGQSIFEDLFLHLRRSEVSSRCGVARTDPDKSCMSSVDSMQEVVGYGKPESFGSHYRCISGLMRSAYLQPGMGVPMW